MMTFEEIKSKEDANKGKNSYKHLPEYDAVYLKLDDWACLSRIKEFTEFCDEAFKEIQTKRASHLIIDLRNNPGGDLLNTEVFVIYLIKEPNLSFEGAVPLTTEKYHKFYHENNPLRFEGTVYLLIGEMSTSASTVFAGIIKNRHSTTIIGQEPVEPPTFFGGSNKFKLPNTELLLSVPNCKIVVPGSMNDGRGIIPDYEVKQRPEDTAKGVDTALKFTMDLIKHVK
jgi:C-terminal processing protease CtpA/Prc